MMLRSWLRTCIAVAGSSALTVLAVTSGSQASSSTAAPVYPDIVEEVPSHLQIQNTKQREWLRFTTVHINVGPGNLQVRGGGQVEPCQIDGIDYDECTVATQELLDANKNVVDVKFTGTTGAQKKQQPRTYWECNGDPQGIASGWADSYHQSTPLQELDITGLPPGEYYLTHEADPDNHWLEGPSSDSPGELNNFTWAKFRLDRQGSNPSVTVIGSSPCEYPVCGFGGIPDTFTAWRAGAPSTFLVGSHGPASTASTASTASPASRTGRPRK